MLKPQLSIACLGATGAVGSEVLRTLLEMPEARRITTFGRRPVPGIQHLALRQETIDIFNPGTYLGKLIGHTTAICTLGVGQPSEVSREQFVAIDKTAVLNFAKACKAEGVRHFSLLSSVGASPNTSYWYLKIKGQLNAELEALGFERLSLFKPSMILTPTNRYDWKQGLTLKVWPLLHPLLQGPLKKYRGVKVEVLGEAMAHNLLAQSAPVEALTWNQIQALGGR